MTDTMTRPAIETYPEPEHDPAICYICDTAPSTAPGEMCADCGASWNRHAAEEKAAGNVTDTCPACGSSGRIADFDDVTYCDAPGCTYRWMDAEPDGCDDERLQMDRAESRYRASLGYPESAR